MIGLGKRDNTTELYAAMLDAFDRGTADFQLASEFTSHPRRRVDDFNTSALVGIAAAAAAEAMAATAAGAAGAATAAGDAAARVKALLEDPSRRVAALGNSTEVADEYGALSRYLAVPANTPAPAPAAAALAGGGEGDSARAADLLPLLEREYVACLKRENAQVRRWPAWKCCL